MTPTVLAAALLGWVVTPLPHTAPSVHARSCIMKAAPDERPEERPEIKINKGTIVEFHDAKKKERRRFSNMHMALLPRPAMPVPGKWT